VHNFKNGNVSLYYAVDIDKSIKNNSIFLDIINENLNIADILICDITPDFIPMEHLNKKSWDITPCINIQMSCMS
jgi:hypothetical protein